MPGATYPITYGNRNRVFATPLEFNSVIGSEKARLLVDCSQSFSPGDPVEIIEVSVNSRIPTGRQVTRYVQYVESRIPMYGDDDYCALHLVPARCMLDSLRK